MQENKKNFIYLLSLIVLIVLLFFLIRPEKINSMEFNILDGEKLKSDDINKILILNFWATDCPTCIKEMPDLAKIHHEFKDDIELIAVAMPYDLPSRVINFKNKNALPFKVAIDPDNRILSEFGYGRRLLVGEYDALMATAFCKDRKIALDSCLGFEA